MPLRRCPTGALLVLLPLGFLLSYLRRTGTAVTRGAWPLCIELRGILPRLLCTLSVWALSLHHWCGVLRSSLAATEPASIALLCLCLAASSGALRVFAVLRRAWVGLGLVAVALPALSLAQGVAHAAAEKALYHYFEFILPIRGSCGAALGAWRGQGVWMGLLCALRSSLLWRCPALTDSPVCGLMGSGIRG